jgi:hypothetical protein
VHFFGTATLSFADGVQARNRGMCSRSARAEFGAPLINGIAPTEAVFVHRLHQAASRARIKR